MSQVSVSCAAIVASSKSPPLLATAGAASFHFMDRASGGFSERRLGSTRPVRIFLPAAAFAAAVHLSETI
jgi:hypothetical protein